MSTVETIEKWMARAQKAAKNEKSIRPFVIRDGKEIVVSNPEKDDKLTGSFAVRMKIILPNGTNFERKGKADDEKSAKKLRELYVKEYKDAVMKALAGEETRRQIKEKPMTLQELADKCRDEWWPAKGRDIDLAHQYHQILTDHVIAYLGPNKPITQITKADWDTVLAACLKYRRKNGNLLETGTIQRIKAVFSSALTRAADNEVIERNPIKGIAYTPDPKDEAKRLGKALDETEDEDSPAKRKLTDDEAKMILEAAKGSCLFPLVVLQLAFGLRIAEALAVKWSDFDWEREELRVRHQVKRIRNDKYVEGGSEPKSIIVRTNQLKSKNGKRNIYLFAESLEILALIPRGMDNELVCKADIAGRGMRNPDALMEPRNAQRAFRDLMEELIEDDKITKKLDRPTPHSMRAWRLTRWANVDNMPAAHLMALAGHSNIETTMKFYVSSSTNQIKQWLSSRAEQPKSVFA